MFGDIPGQPAVVLPSSATLRWLKALVPSWLKALVPSRLKCWMIEHIPFETFDLPEGRKALIFLWPDYGNVGDLAIGEAQRRFLERHGGYGVVVPVPVGRTRSIIQSVARQVKPDDLITIIGGGNMGALYPGIEKLRRLVIQRFPNNRIVCFPQTLDWREGPDGQLELARLAAAYSKHRRLAVFARERVSHRKLLDMFSGSPNVSIGLVPDIVFSLSPQDLAMSDAVPRDGVLLCLRNDKERILTDIQRMALEKAARATGEDVRWTDTHDGRWSGVGAAEARRAVEKKMREFMAAKLVITDRLHGMILAAVTNTPCLALPSLNHKVVHSWEDWLKENGRVFLVGQDRLSEVEKVIGKLVNCGSKDEPAGVPGLTAYETLLASLR